MISGKSSIKVASMLGSVSDNGPRNAAGAANGGGCDRSSPWVWLYEQRQPRPEELASAAADPTRAGVLAVLSEPGCSPNPMQLEALSRGSGTENDCALIVSGIQFVVQAGQDFRALLPWLEWADTVLARSDLLPIERAALLLQASIGEMVCCARLDRTRMLCDAAVPWVEAADSDALRIVLASLRTHCELMAGRIQIALAIGRDGLHVAPSCAEYSLTRLTLRGALGLASMLADRMDDAVDLVDAHAEETPPENMPAYLWLIYMGHRLLVHVAAGTSSRKIEALSDRLRRFSIPAQNLYARSYLHYTLGATALLANQPETALFHARAGLDFALRCHSPVGARTCTLLVIQALADLRQHQDALDWLAAKKAVWNEAGAHLLGACGALEEARLHLACGDMQAAQAALKRARQALPPGEQFPCNLRRPAFIAGLLRQLESPPAPPDTIQPDKIAIRITTMGKFEVTIDGLPLYDRNWHGKRSKTLLKALIVLGGHKVSSSQLSDLIWPDADGDLAKNSLKVTLWRLRHLAPDQGTTMPTWVAMQHGQVSLIAHCCQVDSIEFERALHSALGRRDAIALVEALSRYPADFLPQDDEPWIVAHRARLRMMFLQGVRMLADIDISAARCFCEYASAQGLSPTMQSEFPTFGAQTSAIPLDFT